MSFKDEFSKKQQELKDLQKEVWEMSKRCPHEEKKVKLVETLAFEYTPRYRCLVCNEELRGEIPLNEIKQCYKEEWFEFIEDEKLSEERLDAFTIANPRGFNLPDLNLIDKEIFMTFKEASEIIAAYMLVKYPPENFYHSLDNLVPVWQKLAEETDLEWQGFMVNFFFSPKNDAISLSSNLDGNHPFYRMYPCSEDANDVANIQTSALYLTAKVVKQYLDKEYDKYKG